MTRNSDPVRLTEHLVRFDTVSSEPNAAFCAELADLLEPTGAAVTRQQKPDVPGQQNLIARLGPDRPGGLVLAGHTDTVPFEDSMRATTAPERDGRRLYGRGTCDMKGALAAMVIAARSTDATTLRKPLYLAFTFEEEIGCHGAKHLEATTTLPADHCIIGEPTGLKPVTLHKGYGTGWFRFQGTPCHSSDPAQGASALHAAALAADRLLALGKDWNERGTQDPRLAPPWTTLNLGLMQAGSARNMVPERASLCIEIRPLPGQDCARLFSEAEACVRIATERVQGVSVRFEPDDFDEPLHTDDNEEVVRWLIEQRGEQPGSVPFYTEGPTFNRMGIPTCICGPGDIDQAHRVDEFVAFDALEEAVDLYRAAIQAFCT